MSSSPLIQIFMSIYPAVIVLGIVGLQITALIHLKQHKNMHKPAWTMLIILAPLYGAIGYFIINRDK